jgi:FlaA1/EpsC-like NDP-sugar epimerase
MFCSSTRISSSILSVAEKKDGFPLVRFSEVLYSHGSLAYAPKATREQIAAKKPVAVQKGSSSKASSGY